jgi:acetyl-CoA synthetase
MGKVVDFNMAEANIKWFVDAKVNITKIVLTDTLPKKATKRNHFEPNDPSEEALHISYTELHQRVCKMANVLQGTRSRKGDRVCIYLPMIPELAITLSVLELEPYILLFSLDFQHQQWPLE